MSFSGIEILEEGTGCFNSTTSNQFSQRYDIDTPGSTQNAQRYGIDVQNTQRSTKFWVATVTPTGTRLPVHPTSSPIFSDVHYVHEEELSVYDEGKEDLS